MNTKNNILVIGGGAAGFFSAINAAINFPDAKIMILEKTGKILSKVKISGGGRCNVTNYCFEINELVKNYPRGEKELRQVFAQFSVQDTLEWFQKRGVKLKIEADGRVFPETNSSDTIIDCFLKEAHKLGISINLGEEVLSIEKSNQHFISVKTNKQTYIVNSVICSIGGHNQMKNYQFLVNCGHSIDELIPSLFTLNLPQNKSIKILMGLSIKNGIVRVVGTKKQYSGPILITHWGLSGPAVLKLSAFAAYDLFKLSYKAPISVNWTGNSQEENIKMQLESNLALKSMVVNTPLFDIPKRLWEYLILRSEIEIGKPWNELGRKQLNKLVQILYNDIYQMEGKTTFKEEFVTAGGINLKEVNFKTMESKKIQNLFFCGEVLNIDGVTGGFNFQNAWSTAWIAAKNALS